MAAEIPAEALQLRSLVRADSMAELFLDTVAVTESGRREVVIRVEAALEAFIWRTKPRLVRPGPPEGRRMTHAARGPGPNCSPARRRSWFVSVACPGPRRMRRPARRSTVLSLRSPAAQNLSSSRRPMRKHLGLVAGRPV
jgi:hypothetical protein